MAQNIKTINLGFVNAFLVKAKGGFILVDSGVPDSFERLEKELISAGALPGKLKLTIITHGDMDHLGCCKMLKKKYGVKVAIHKLDAPMVEKGVFMKRKITTLGFRILFFIMMMIRKMKKPSNESSFKPDILLKDGQSLEKYGFDAKVIHLPGHTPGSIGILTKDHDFFAGDTLNNGNRPKTANIIENQEELDKSIEKIKKLGIRRVYVGHGKDFLMKELFA